MKNEKKKKKSTKREIYPWMSEIDTWNEHIVKKKQMKFIQFLFKLV